MEWVEIIEPRTKEHMYANLTTGECVWNPPPGVSVKKTDDNQWWELFDQNTSRFYYYNAISQKTVWHRPSNCDIIPLAKLQTLKQNTQPEAEDGMDECKLKESVGTQTSGKCVRPPKPVFNRHVKTSVCSETQTSPGCSPRPSRRYHHHSHSHSHGHSHRHHYTGGNVLPITPQKTNQSQDSGRSSDSSSRTSLDGQKILESPLRNRYNATSLSTSTSTPIIKKKPLQEINSQSAKLPDVGEKNESFRSTNKCTSGSMGTSQNMIARCKGSQGVSAAKQKSFDVETSLGVGGCYSNYGHENFRGRCKTDKTIQTSKSVVSVGIGSDLTRSYSFVQRKDTSLDEEDSMHEKYFLLPNESEIRNIESTPLAKTSVSSEGFGLNMVTTSGHSQDQNAKKIEKIARGKEHVDGNCDSQSVSSENETSNTSQSPLTTSPVSNCRSSSSDWRKSNRLNQINSLPDAKAIAGKFLDRDRAHYVETKMTPYEEAKENEEKFFAVEFLKETCVDSYPKQINHRGRQELVKKKNYNDIRESFRGEDREHHKEKMERKLLNTKDSFGENGNFENSSTRIKFYSVDRNYEKFNSAAMYGSAGSQSYEAEAKNQSHLFPLHQYILEQAKLSGCYKFGDPLSDELDSLHSEDEASMGRAEYDSDEFADDEGMSNQGDSSSQEYLDDPNYFEPEEYIRKYDKFPEDFKNDSDYMESLKSRAALYAESQGVYYSGVASSPYFQYLPSPGRTLNFLETQHTSLKKKKDEPADLISSPCSPVLEKNENTNRPVSLPSKANSKASTDDSESPRAVLSRDRKLPSESDIEEYAQGHLNIHKKGIFRKKFSVRDMLSWSKDPIRKPMLVLEDKALKKDACDLFKLVQIYMSDRKAKIGMTLNGVALEICNLAYGKPRLRDELYVQICRQTTENPRRESLRRGWELMAICLSFFPPSAKFQTYLDGYMNRHRDPGFDFPEVVKWPIHVQISHYATVGCKRLERIGCSGKKPAKKPTIEDIDQSRLQIFRASMFGSTLEEVMFLQKERFPSRKLPWVQTVLSEEILRLQGAQTEGIFRVSADVDEVNLLKVKIDHWDVPTETLDAHAPASLLKLWYRELYEPLIPDALYEDCVTHHDDPEFALAIVQRLPNLNKLVLCYLVRFLQIFSRDEIVQVTKMDASNLATVMAPNCLRCTSQDPRVIFDNARKEMSFMKTLIQSLDTSFMEGIL